MNKELQSFWVKHGLYAGLIHGIFLLLLYFINRELLANIWLLWAISFFALIYPLVATTRYRKAHQNVLIYKDAFASVFFISIIRGIIAGLVWILLVSVIDPELAGFLKSTLIKNTGNFMQSMGVPEGQIETQLDQIKNNPSPYELINQVKGILFLIPIAAFLSLIGAAIVKRNPTPFSDNSLDVPAN